LSAREKSDWEGYVSRTITTGVQVDDTANTDVDNTEETLILLLELLLVKDLNGEDALFVGSPAGSRQLSKHVAEKGSSYMSKLSFQ
jgi:hypothetical protein